jgi:hypothetical protein
VHPLDAHYVWREGRDLEALPTRVQQLRAFLETYDGSLENDAAVGVRAFAKSRLEREINAVSVVHPQHLSLPPRRLLGTFVRQAGFETYTCLSASVTAMRAYDLDQDVAE